MRGRKPKPTHLKLLEGNPGRRSLNRNEPRPQVKVPTCPQHLCPSAKAEWKRLAPQLFVLGVLTALDRTTLAAYCQAYGRWVEAEQKLKRRRPSQTAVRLLPAKSLADHCKQATRNDAQVPQRAWPLAGIAQPRQCRVQHPKPWEFGTSKFAGLLGKADPDEFFGD
jgi:P27 family predicted phage terminase small subunit